MIRWLHIADLHILQKADWRNYKKELLQKCSRVGKIDLVIVTGDFHNFVDGNNFQGAEAFLRDLMNGLDLDINKDLFLVPGNHDGVNSFDDKEVFTDMVMNHPLELKSTWLEKVLGAFQDYEAFVKRLIPLYPEEHPARVHNRIWRNRINFIHCNTAIGADGRSKNEQVIDVDGLAAVEFSELFPNILLGHNYFFDLNIAVQNRVKDVIRSNSVCAYLCGDRHIENVEQITYENNQNRQIPCVCCYKSAPDATDTYSMFGMIIGEWITDKVILKGWTWKSGEGFQIDNSITEQEIQMGFDAEEMVIQETEVLLAEDRSIVEEGKQDVALNSEKQLNKKVRFVHLYYNLTPDQMDAFNRKYVKENIKLKVKLSDAELIAYAKNAERIEKLDDIIEYMERLLQ